MNKKSYFKYIILIVFSIIFLITSCEIGSNIVIDDTTTESMEIENVVNKDVKLDALHDIYDRWFTQFVLTVGDKTIYFEGFARAWDKAPTPIVTDMTGDGVPDIIVIIDTYLGIGTNIQEIHIFDGVTFEQYEIRDAEDILRDQLKFSADDEYYYISTKLDTFVIIKDNVINNSEFYTEYPERLPYELQHFYLFCKYKINDGLLYVYLPFNTGGTEFYGMTEIIYELSSNCFDFISITVIEEDFFETVYD